MSDLVSDPVNNGANQADGALSPPRHASPQIERRLARLGEQIDALALALDHVQESAHVQQDQVAALLRAATATEREQALNEHLADLVSLLNAQGEQTAELAASVQGLARASHVQTLADEVARHEQLEALEGRLAKLVRTQFKSNTLNESQLGQLESALAILREVAEAREARVEERLAQEHARLEEARVQGRRELVADLLPGIDGLALVLQNGRALVARQRTVAEATRARSEQAQPPAEAPPLPPWRERLQSVFAGQSAAAPSSVPTATAATAASGEQSEQAAQIESLLDDSESWLAGLALAHERFLALLAAERIDAINALGQPFDPRLHVAVDMVEDVARPANVVAQVVRQGYRQGDRVLRYAEVVVTRTPAALNEESASGAA